MELAIVILSTIILALLLVLIIMIKRWQIVEINKKAVESIFVDASKVVERIENNRSLGGGRKWIEIGEERDELYSTIRKMIERYNRMG